MIRRPNPFHTFLTALLMAFKQISIAAAWAACAICVTFGASANLFVLFPFAALFGWFAMSMTRTLNLEELARIQALRDADEETESPDDGPRAV